MKKFRFPKGITQVNIPALAPYELETIAAAAIHEALARFSGLPKKARVRFEYRYTGDGPGVMDVQIYKTY